MEKGYLCWPKKYFDFYIPQNSKLENEKVKAELQLLYLEKKEAENELIAIREEISKKEAISNNTSLASSARLEALEIGSKVK